MSLRVCLLILLCLDVAAPAVATDVDGPNDCSHENRDFGDAPEGIFAYPGVIGHFPTCLAPTAPGTQTFACPPISTPPGPTGYVNHVALPAVGNYWLGCYLAAGLGPFGIDGEPNGKTNTPAVGVSACDGTTPTDCIEAAFGLTFDQDECFGDGSDFGVARPTLPACSSTGITFSVYNCVNPRQVQLNVCIDWNADGDWNDNILCPDGTCAYEWAVVNAPIFLPTGCTTFTSPLFKVGPRPGQGWMRVSISDDPMPPDYPWNGTVSLPGQVARGGETEDYPVFIEEHVGVGRSTWGTFKHLYR